MSQRRFRTIPFLSSLACLWIDSLWSQAAKRFVGAPLRLLEEEIREKIDTSLLVSKTRSLGQQFASLSSEEKTALDTERWGQWVRKYHQRLHHERLTVTPQERSRGVEQMRRANPAFVLRNWIAFKVTEAAERGDYSKVDLVLKMLQDPHRPELSIFSESPLTGCEEFIRVAPDWAPSFTCTCSS
jgi:uncharacterized protein YdiU (UPF0061 family)